MTQEEFKKKYGVEPKLPESPKVATDTAPVKMTREEYEMRFNADPFALPEETQAEDPGVAGTLLRPLNEGVSGLKELYGGGEKGIASKLKKNVEDAATDIAKGDKVKGVAKAGFRTAGDVVGLIYAPIGAAIGATGIGHVFEYIGELSQKGGEYNPLNMLTDVGAVQSFVADHPNLEEDFGRALNLAFAKAETGKIDPSTVIARTIDDVVKVKGAIGAKVDQIQLGRKTKLIKETADEIGVVEQKYVKGRKMEYYEKDGGAASRDRIAQSGVLRNTVDEDGLLRTQTKGGAIEQYEKMTVKPAERIVRTILEHEGKKVNLSEVRKSLDTEVRSSGLEGADLATALKGIEKEIDGLRIRADELGYIPVSLLHDAKINTTKNINFQTPPETATYRKAVARTYKKMVEDLTDANVKEINGELAKYYGDIERLQMLDGARVSGGKLGKYTSQITGNVAGGIFGAVIGGPVGASVGTIIGGEIGSKIRGKMMSKSFNKSGEGLPSNPILDEAVQKYNSDPKNAKTPIEQSAPLDKASEVTPTDLSTLVDSAGKHDLRTVMVNLERGGYSKGQIAAIMGKAIENNNTGRFTPKEISEIAAELLPETPRRSTAIIKDRKLPPEEQIAETAYQKTLENGGVTINLGGNMPKNGFAYAPEKGTERVISKADFEKKGDQFVQDFIDEHKAILSKPGYHIGGRESEGKVYLDISKVGTASVKTIEEAQKASQLAVFDLGNFEEIATGQITYGVYNKIDEAINVYDQYFRKVTGANKEGNEGGGSEVPGNPKDGEQVISP